MKRTYFFILALGVCVIMAGYLLNIPEIINFTDKTQRLMRNVWIAIPAIIFSFIAVGKRYWISLIICGLIDAVFVQFFLWENNSIGLESTLMMTFAFLTVAYFINLVKAIFR